MRSRIGLREMKSERSVVRSRFLEAALEVVKEEHDFLEEIGRLGLPKKTIAREPLSP